MPGKISTSITKTLMGDEPDGEPPRTELGILDTPPTADEADSLAAILRNTEAQFVSFQDVDFLGDLRKAPARGLVFRSRWPAAATSGGGLDPGHGRISSVASALCASPASFARRMSCFNAVLTESRSDRQSRR